MTTITRALHMASFRCSSDGRPVYLLLEQASISNCIQCQCHLGMEHEQP